MVLQAVTQVVVEVELPMAVEQVEYLHHPLAL
jgi:hypothetical protein